MNTNNLSAVSASILLDPRVSTPKNKRLQKKSGDGSNFSPGYIVADAEDTQEVSQNKGQNNLEQGYAIKLGGNAKVRQYSGAIGKINKRISTLQVLSSTYSDLSTKASELADFVGTKRSVAEFEDDDVSELIALATEYEDRRRAIVRHSKASGAENVAPEPLDMPEVLASPGGFRSFKGQIDTAIAGIEKTIIEVNRQFEEIKPELAANSPAENEDNIDALLADVREELSEQRNQALDGQANLDSTLVYRLLSWNDNFSQRGATTMHRSISIEKRQKPNEVITR